MTKEIPLTKGKVAIVDKDDFDRLNKYKWYYEDSGYACRRKTFGYYDNKKVYMHREILGDITDKNVVDHINRDGLDNRKLNLRIVTQSHNMFNTGLRRNNSSGYKGVSKSGNRWRASIHIDGKSKHLGTFATKEEAARKYNEVALQEYGDIAYINEINNEGDFNGIK